MKILFFIILFVILRTNTVAQSGWVIQQGVQDNPLLEQVYFADQHTGWAVGEVFIGSGYGIIIRTTNSGLNWSICYADTSHSYFSCIYFINQLTGWAGGVGGSILKTTNGGDNWFVTWSGRQFWPGSIYFINSNTGWASGDTLNKSGLIIKTTNGGDSWEYQNSGTTYWLSTVDFIDENTGWICGGYGVYGGIILKTTNGGINWIIQYQDTLFNNLHDINFVNQYTGWAFGENSYSYGKIVKTTNSGLNWSLVFQSPYITYSLFFINENTGWIGGYNNISHNGNILNTTNGGVNWFEQFAGSGPNHEFFSIYFVNPNLGWAVGNNGIIISTTNGGNPIGIEPISLGTPNRFYLFQNYPNPFNPVTKIKFSIPPSKGTWGMITSLVIYDVLGKEIEVLVSKEMKSGTYEVTWDASNYPSGVYFYKLSSSDFSLTRKMVLIK